VATCKAVVTTQGYLSPRIAVLEGQIPRPARHVDEGELWELLHRTDYLVHRRYELSCLCEREPAALAAEEAGSLLGPTSVVAPALAGAVISSPNGVGADLPAVNGAGTGEDLDGLPVRSVDELALGLVEHGTRVRVVGRAITSGPGLFRLADGPTTVPVSGVDVAEYTCAAPGTRCAASCGRTGSRCSSSR
jgi:hypothetical protein